MNTGLKGMDGALLAACLVLCSYMAQSAMAATRGARAYPADEPHLLTPQHFDNDTATSTTAQIDFRIRKNLYPTHPFDTTQRFNGMRGAIREAMS